MMRTMKHSIWWHLTRPAYVLTGAPWVALFALLIRPATWMVLSLGAIFLVGVTLSSVPWLFLPIILLFPLTFVMIPIFALWFGAVERWRLQVLGFDSLQTGHVPLSVSPLRRWIGVRYQEPATWREVLAVAIGSILDLFALMLVGTEALLLGFCGALAFHLGVHREYLPELIYLPWLNDGKGVWFEMGPAQWWIPLVLAAVGLIFAAYLNGVLAGLSGVVSHALLAPRPEEIQRQVDRLTFSRTALMDSFESERRRIERDLHDGVQQQLVNLNLRLGMAEFELQNAQQVQDSHRSQQGELSSPGSADGPVPWSESRPGGVVDLEPAREQITQAQQQVQQALQTLRNTVRGIYPAVLEDHGLRAALEELSNSSLLPLHVNYCATTILPPKIARTGYYIVNEAVTNAVKHSTATQVRILVHSADGRLILEITDNGQGGADSTRGTGITGIEERANAVDGTLTVESPRGGPTTLRASLPLGRENTGRVESPRPEAEPSEVG